VNDDHDNAATDREVSRRVERITSEHYPETHWDAAEPATGPLRPKTGRLITRADLDQWALGDDG
jgi:hypothetical protein